MIRYLAFAALALLAACQAAEPVDTSARYVRQAPSGPVTVQAAANGDARVEAGDTVFVRKGGVDYVVLKDGHGDFAAKRDDVLAYFAEAGKGSSLFGGPRAQPGYVTSEGGTETVAGIEGTLWRVHVKDVPSLPAAEAVVSTDPALAPLGRALAMQSNFSIIRNSALGGGPGNLEKAMMALFDKGTVLRFGNALTLEKLDHASIAASAFALPATVLDTAGLKARMEAERARLAAPPVP